MRKRFKCGVRSAECGVRSAKSGIDDAWDSCLKMPAKRPLPAVSRRQTIFQPAFRNLCESPVAAVCDRPTILKIQCCSGHRPPLPCGHRLLQGFRIQGCPSNKNKLIFFERLVVFTRIVF